MSELQHYYENVACAGVWSDPDPKECGCHGNGWWCSEVDTWHTCRYHFKNQPHPEDFDREEPTEEDIARDRLHCALMVLFAFHERCIRLYREDDIPF